MSKEKAERVFQIVCEKEGKEKKAVGKFILRTYSESGVKVIKEILDIKDAEIRYLGSSKFSISVSGKDFKEANNKLVNVLEEIEKRAKEKKAVFEVKKEK